MATFFSGWGYQGCWNHPDNNTFTFYAKGESFVIDLGANFKTPQEHNVVLVDGTGFYYNAPSMIVGYINANKDLSNGARYIKGDNSDSYREAVLTESTREFIYKGGDTPYVIAFDYVYAGKSSHEFTTNFYTDTTSTIELVGTNKAKIVGGNTGSVGLAYVYSQEGAGFSVAKGTNTLALRTTNNAVTHKQAVVFTTQMPDGKEPTVTWSTVNEGLKVAIKYQNNNTEVTDTYIFSSSNEVVQSTSEHKHNLVRTAPQSATCTTSGNIEYFTCSSCGRVFADSDCTQIISQTIIPALGHSLKLVEEVMSTCTKEGLYSHYHCISCGENYSDEECKFVCPTIIMPVKSHDYTWNEEVPAQVGNSGIKGHYHCGGCNQNFDANYNIINDLMIPALSSSSSSTFSTTSTSSTIQISSSESSLDNTSSIFSISQSSTSSKQSEDSSSCLTSSSEEQSQTSSCSNSVQTSSSQEIVSSTQSSNSKSRTSRSRVTSNQEEKSTGCTASIGSSIFLLVGLMAVSFTIIIKKRKL